MTIKLSLTQEELDYLFLLVSCTTADVDEAVTGKDDCAEGYSVYCKLEALASNRAKVFADDDDNLLVLTIM